MRSITKSKLSNNDKMPKPSNKTKKPKSLPKDFYTQKIDRAPHLEKDPEIKPSRSELKAACKRAYKQHEDEIVRAYRRDGVIICDYPLSADIDKQGFRVNVLSDPMNFRKLRYMLTDTFSKKTDIIYYNLCGNKYCCRPSHNRIGTQTDINLRRECPGYLTWTENDEKVYYKACTHTYPCKVITDIEDSEITHEKCLGLVNYNGRSIGSCIHKGCKRYNVSEEDLVEPELIDQMSPEDSKKIFSQDSNKVRETVPLSADEIEQKIQDLIDKSENMTEEEKREIRNKRAENTRERNKRNRTYEKRRERRRKQTRDSDEDDDPRDRRTTRLPNRADGITEFYYYCFGKVCRRINGVLVDDEGVPLKRKKPEEDSEEEPEEEEELEGGSEEEPEKEEELEEEGSDEEPGKEEDSDEEPEEQHLDTSTTPSTQSENIHADEVEPIKTVYMRRKNRDRFNKKPKVN